MLEYPRAAAAEILDEHLGDETDDVFALAVSMFCTAREGFKVLHTEQPATTSRADAKKRVDAASSLCIRAGVQPPTTITLIDDY